MALRSRICLCAFLVSGLGCAGNPGRGDGEGGSAGAESGGSAGSAGGEAGSSATGNSGSGGGAAGGSGAGVGGAAPGDAGVSDGGLTPLPDAAPDDPGTPLYFVGCDPPTLWISGNGRDWKKTLDLGGSPQGGHTAFHDIDTGGGVAVAVGNSGVYISRNGTIWKQVMTDNLHGSRVAYGGGRWVIVAGGTAHLSDNGGENWSPVTLPSGLSHWSGLQWGRGVDGKTRWFGGGDASGAPRFKTSEDGRTWVSFDIASGQPRANGAPAAIAYGGGRWVSASPAGMIVFDGTNFGNFQYVEVKNDKGEMISSQSLAYGPGGFRIMWFDNRASSVDGLTWTVSRPRGPWADYGMIHGDQGWLGLNGNNMILSTTGLEFTTVSTTMPGSFTAHFGFVGP